MKNTAKKTLAMLLCLVMVIGLMPGMTAWAEGSSTSTLTFTQKCYGSGTADDNVTWTVTSDADESNFEDSKGIHYGTQNKAVQYIRLSTSGITGTITKVVVNASYGSSYHDQKVGVSVGGTAFGGEQAIDNIAADYTFTGSGSGEIIVNVTKSGSYTGALYVKSIAVTYTSTVAVTGVTLDKNSATLTVGGTETLTATVAPDDATDKSVTWASDNTAVATVDQNGVVTAVASGTANITVTSNADANKSASCAVTVNAAAPATYTVTWKNGDTTLKTDTVEEGTAPAYTGTTPEQAEDESYTYTFSGWSDGTNAYGATDTLPAVTADVTYTATFTATAKKANPTAPTGLTATYGQKLSDVALPTGWTWADDTLSVGDVGSNTFKANFAGDINYNAASDVDVTVTVSEAANPATGETKQVTFNGKQWYVIDKSETAGTLTLLYAGTLGNYPFDTNGSNNYANSSIKAALDGLTAESGFYYPVADAIKDTENGKLYLLSVDEANEVPQNVRADFPDDAWWLRTARDGGKVAYVYVTAPDTPGRIPNSGAAPTEGFGVRPALQLDLSKVVYDAGAYYIPVTAPTGITVTGATLAEGYGVGSVSVTATAADGHTLSYQWYQSATNSNEGGDKIEGATSATYNIPTGNAVGEYYYYCVVTATRTDNNQTASVTSDVATVTVAANTDALVAKLAEENNIDLSQYYRIPAEDMYFTANEYWNINSSWEKLPDEAGHVATKQFTKQGLPENALIFCKAYYAFEAVAWVNNTGNSETIGKRYSLLTKISDQFAWWNSNSLFGFNLTKYAEGDFNTIEAADVSSISDAFRIYVPKPADAAEVNGTGYPTVADAIRAAGAGGTVKLLRNVTENVVLKAGTNIVLDLNGHTLTNDGRHCTILAQNGSTLVVTGNGIVDNTTHGCAPLYNNGGTVTLNGGTFTRSDENGDGGNTYYTVVNRGTMTINEGVTVTNDAYHYSSLIINGYNGLNKTGNREIDPKVSNGYVVGESAEKPTLTINGGTFTGGNQALKNDVKGVATINGGSFSSSGGHAIKNLSELTISGGTFTANAEGKFALYSAESGTATVTGGTFNGKLQKDEGATITINGGEFSDYGLGSIDFQGGSLRRRVYRGTDTVIDFETDLRFGFKFKLPAGAVVDTNNSYFRWKLNGSATANDGNKAIMKNGSFEGEKYVSNMVITGVPKAFYQADINCFVHLVYTLDGIEFVMEANEDSNGDAYTRSVETVCEGLTKDADTPQLWKDYAQMLLNTIQ